MTTRRYHWTTERPKDQAAFLTSVVKVYKEYTHGRLPELINFAPPPSQPQPPSQQQVPPDTDLNERKWDPLAYDPKLTIVSSISLPPPPSREYRPYTPSTIWTLISCKFFLISQLFTNVRQPLPTFTFRIISRTTFPG